MNQRLECYRLLVDVAKAMPDLISRFPRGESYLIDQLKRALLSSILNLAEGNGRYSTKERNRFFDFSLASISEVTGCIEYAQAFRFINADTHVSLIDKLNKAYYMIRKLKK